MRLRTGIAILVCLVASGGCAKQKSTTELVTDLTSAEEGQRIVAVRLLPQHKGDAAQIVPALMAALSDKSADVRWSAAIGLGYFHEKAKEAIPALQDAKHDRDARVREAAGVALGRIDPSLAPNTAVGKARGQ
jgi:HEAT repeat protein